VRECVCVRERARKKKQEKTWVCMYVNVCRVWVARRFSRLHVDFLELYVECLLKIHVQHGKKIFSLQTSLVR